MQDECRNIYYNARRTSGLTQERWAEVLGISVESVRLYEGGVNMPSDTIVLRMAEVAGQQIICYWHLLNKSRVASALLPEIQRKPLPEAVLNLLVKLRDFSEDGMTDLQRIAVDGRVDPLEREPFEYAMKQLRELVAAGLQVEYAEKEGAE
jgi:predicted transcriptional regulator